MMDFLMGFGVPLLVFLIAFAVIVTVCGITMGIAAMLDWLADYIVERWWKHGKR